MVSEKNNELKSLAKGKKMTSKGTDGKVMVRQDEPPVCTDWYWTTYTYDQWGNITSILSEVYVYTTCEGEDGGGGDGDTPPLPDEFIPDFGYSVSVDEGGEAEETTLIGGVPGKVARRTWIFHDGYTYWGKSREKLVVKIIDGIRTWHSITHEEYYKVGGWALGNVEYLSVSVIPFLFEAESAGNATVEARYRVRLTPSVYNQNFDSEYKYSYATCYPMFQKTQ